MNVTDEWRSPVSVCACRPSCGSLMLGAATEGGALSWPICHNLQPVSAAVQLTRASGSRCCFSFSRAKNRSAHELRSSSGCLARHSRGSSKVSAVTCSQLPHSSPASSPASASASVAPRCKIRPSSVLFDFLFSFFSLCTGPLFALARSQKPTGAFLSRFRPLIQIKQMIACK